MVASDHLSHRQFNLMLPDLGHTGRTVSLSVPEAPAGHTRLYRFTNDGGKASGFYADRPQASRGTEMHYVDVPTGDLPRYAASESGGKGEYRHPGTGSVRVNPFTHPGAKVKDYEMNDWDL